MTNDILTKNLSDFFKKGIQVEKILLSFLQKKILTDLKTNFTKFELSMTFPSQDKDCQSATKFQKVTACS